MDNIQYYIETVSLGDEAYKNWLFKVGKIMERQYDLDIEDVGDSYDLKGIYKNGVTAHKTATLISREILGLNS